MAKERFYCVGHGAIVLDNPLTQEQKELRDKHTKFFADSEGRVVDHKSAKKWFESLQDGDLEIAFSVTPISRDENKPYGEGVVLVPGDPKKHVFGTKVTNFKELTDLMVDQFISKGEDLKYYDHFLARHEKYGVVPE